MNKLNRNLLIVLALQIALVLFFQLRGGDTSIGKLEPVLAGFDKDKVERVRVFDRTTKSDDPAEAKTETKGKPGENPAIDLVKKGDSWLLASHFDYPVEASKVTDLLSKIESARSRGPIASGKARQKQLDVADDSYERKVVLTAGGTDRVIYVGSAAGARQTSLRLGGGNDIHGVTGLSPFAMGTSATSWVDTNYIDIPEDKIASIDVVNGNGSFHFEHLLSGEWTATVGGQPLTPPAGMEIKKSEISNVASRVSKIFLADPGDPKRAIDKPLATVTVRLKAQPVPPEAGADAGAAPAESTLAGGEKVIEIAATDKKDRYYVREKGRAEAALVDALSVTEFVELSRDRLLAKIGEQKAEAPGGHPPIEGLPPGFDPSQLEPQP